MQTTYHFGLLVKEIDIFSYPRTGAHFLRYCLSGLFDVISLPHPYLTHAEAVDRQQELNADVLYALGLREPDVPFRPVYFNARRTGVHGLPAESDGSILVLIRDPIATAYSRLRVERDRWGGITDLTSEWLSNELRGYSAFYDRATEVLARQGNRGLLIRWEDLVDSPRALEDVVSFVGLPAKLRPSLVWMLTRFDHFAEPGRRTFYRSGNNTAWKADSQWVRILSRLEDQSFHRFGYGSVMEYLSSARP